MKKFVFTFMASGGLTIEADSKEEAQKKFDAVSNAELLNELEVCSIEQTACFEEEE